MSGPFVVTCSLGDGQTEAVRVDEDVEQGAGAYAQVTFVATDTGGVDWSGEFDDVGLRCDCSPTG